MADSSLDDFFAKKDKSKRKPKGKPESTISGDIEDVKLAKKEKARKGKDKENVASGSQMNVTSHPPKEDEEWKDYEEEREVDYTGLRIQTLKMSKEDQDKDGGDGNGDRDDEDESKGRRDGASGPWNKSGGQGPAAPAASNIQFERTEVTKDEPVQRVPGKYVPPAQRAGASAPSGSKMSSSRKKKDAPNVNSEEDFPTLGGVPGSKKGWSQQYSSTASSDLIDNAGQRRGVNLTLENKFSALQD